MLFKKFKHCSDDVKHRLFKTFCYNGYGGHLWTMFSKVVLRKDAYIFRLQLIESTNQYV